MIAALVTDMIFRSRITATAAAGKVNLRMLVRLDDLRTLLEAGGVTLLIVDMDAADDVAVAAIAMAAGQARRPRIVAYLSHVQKELAVVAQQAGADMVLPRSAFVQRLAELLQVAESSDLDNRST